MVLNPLLQALALASQNATPASPLSPDAGTRLPGALPAFGTGSPVAPTIPNVVSPATSAQNVPDYLQQGAEARANALRLLQQAGQVPDPQIKRPAFRTADLLGLGLAALAGNQGGQVLEGYLGAKEQKAQQDTQLAFQQAERARQALFQQAQAQGQEAGDFYDAAARADDIAFKNKSLESTNARAKVDDDRMAAQNRETNANTILQRYQQAKTLPEMQSLAKRYNKLVDSDLALDDLAVETAFKERQTQFIDDAQKRLEVSISRALNQFGEVDASTAKQLNEERRRLATLYNIPIEAMQFVPTGETLKAEAATARRKEFAQAFDLKKQSYASTLASRMANLDLAERRLKYTQEHGNAMLGVAQGNLGVAQARLAQSQYDAALKDAYGDQKKALKGIDQQLASKRAALRDAKAAGRKTDAIENAISGLQGQRAFVVGLLPQDLQSADFAANAPLVGTGKQVYDKPQTMSPVTQGKARPSSGLRFDPTQTPGINVRGAIGGGGYKPNVTTGGVKWRKLGQ